MYNKNMTDKKITIEDLAVMVKNGFDKTSTKEQFDGLEKRVGNIEKDVKSIKDTLESVVGRSDKLETRVDFIENTLALPKKN